MINTLITECIAWPITPPDFREKTSEYMVPPIGSLTLFFAALRHSIFRCPSSEHLALMAA